MTFAPHAPPPAQAPTAPPSRVRLARALPFAFLALAAPLLAAASATWFSQPGWLDLRSLLAQVPAGAAAGLVVFALALGRRASRRLLARAVLVVVPAGAIVLAGVLLRVHLLNHFPGDHASLFLFGFAAAWLVAGALAAVFDPGWGALLPRWMVAWLPSWPSRPLGGV